MTKSVTKRKTSDEWLAIRVDYEANIETVKAIALRHAISEPAIQYHVGREGWIRRQSVRNTERPALIERMAKMLERQIAHLEKNMTPGDEKEVALLGTMARSLEKLMDLDRKGVGKAPDKKRDREIGELRQKLAARIDQLRKQ